MISLTKEREIISIFEEADQKSLNYLVTHAKLGLLFYKIKDHRNFSGQHRTEFIELLAVERISALTVISRVVILHALQMMKLPANARAEYWVRNIIISSHQDYLSELKTLMDAKGDYFSMTKLIYDDIRSETVRQDILTHLRKEAAIQEAHMAMGTRKSKLRRRKAWRKVLSDVDDTLTCSGGSYPAGIDKRFGKKVVYPGVLGFYRELDLGATGPEEWIDGNVGNLVFLSARPHIYKDVSEKHNFAKFEKLLARGGANGRSRMHTVPSLLAGDVASGREYIVTNDMEPLAQKKFENFKQYVSIYPEFQHVFVGDNGQGDVRAGELMFDAFPEHLEALYVHVVQDRQKTCGYNPDAWRKKGFRPCFFKTYPEAALDAALRKFIHVEGLLRICQDAINDFYMIQTKEWPTQRSKAHQRAELNQGIWRANQFLVSLGKESVPLIEVERVWKDNEMVRTPYGIAKVLSFDSIYDLYEVELDWRPLDVQVAEHKDREAKGENLESGPLLSHGKESGNTALETVIEVTEEIEEDNKDNALDTARNVCLHQLQTPTNMPKDTVSTDNSFSSNTRENAVDEQVSPPQCSSFPQDLTESDGISTLAPLSDSNPNKSSPCELQNSTDDDHLAKMGNLEVKSPSLLENWSHPVIAKIQGSDLRKYSPPLLPSLPRESRSIFSFWGAGDSSKSKAEEYKLGDKCTTPFGPAKVVEYRKGKKIVVVDMIGWDGRAYLQRECVKVISEGLWKSLLRRLYLTDAIALGPTKVSPGPTKIAPGPIKTRQKARKELEFPYAVGTTIHTPYGEGIVSRPLPLSDVITTYSDKNVDLSDCSTSESTKRINPKPLELTIGISLTSWMLADESYPILYCTVETAKKWKTTLDGKVASSSLFSVVGSLVSKGLKRMTSQVASIPPEAKPPLFERYYQDGASVETIYYGNGMIKSFRRSDGFYVVSLVDWKMMDGSNPVAYLQKDALRYCIAKGCHEGLAVLTSLGISGILAKVEPTTGNFSVAMSASFKKALLDNSTYFCFMKFLSQVFMLLQSHPCRWYAICSQKKLFDL